MGDEFAAGIRSWDLPRGDALVKLGSTVEGDGRSLSATKYQRTKTCNRALKNAIGRWLPFRSCRLTSAVIRLKEHQSARCNSYHWRSNGSRNGCRRIRPRTGGGNPTTTEPTPKPECVTSRNNIQPNHFRRGRRFGTTTDHRGRGVPHVKRTGDTINYSNGSAMQMFDRLLVGLSP